MKSQIGKNVGALECLSGFSLNPSVYSEEKNWKILQPKLSIILYLSKRLLLTFHSKPLIGTNQELILILKYESSNNLIVGVKIWALF